jgi:hypothetical protein
VPKRKRSSPDSRQSASRWTLGYTAESASCRSSTSAAWLEAIYIKEPIPSDTPRRPAPMPVAGLILRVNTFPLLLWLGLGAFVSIIFSDEFPTKTLRKTRWTTTRQRRIKLLEEGSWFS